MGMDAGCESCRQGMTLDDFCMFNPGWSYGGCPTNRRRSRWRPNRRPGNQICCMSMDASCESCRQGMTLDDFCLANPAWEYGGCPEDEPLACCMSMDAGCESCRQGMTLDDFCLVTPAWEYGGCPEDEPLACC